MTRGISIWLDALRVLATFIVVLSHIAYPRFTRGDYIIIRDLNLGSDSVIVFFVISGLVIAYAASRDENLSTYAFNRVTRLFSVLIPAILLTFALDQIGRAYGPEAYSSHYYPASFMDMLVRGISMSNEWGFAERIRLGSNGPLWSLSYEAAYYILFAAAFFLTGARRAVILLVIILIVGPRVLLLMPAWLMGVWVWNWLQSGGADRLSNKRAWFLALTGPVFYLICQAMGAPHFLAALTSGVFEPLNYRLILAFSDEFIWNALIGVMAALHIMGMARLLRAYQGQRPAIRWWAGASFSIYVTHYPILHLIDALFPAETYGRDALFLIGSILIGLLFAHIFERRIGGLRAFFRAIPSRARRQSSSTI